MKTLGLLLGFIFLAYIIYVAIFFMLQRKMLFPLSELPPADASLIKKANGHLHRLSFSQGEFEIVYLPATNNTKQKQTQSPVIFLAHGNGNIIDDWANRMDFMRASGYGVVLSEYPGYGRSDGEPTYKTIKETIAIAYEWIESHSELDQQRIILAGRSMGGGAVLSLIPEKQPQAIILVSTYSSIAYLAAKRGIPSFLVRDPFDNVSALSQYSGKSYLVHGTEDKTVAIDSLHKLLAVAQNASHKIYRFGHSDTPDNWQQFWQDVLRELP